MSKLDNFLVWLNDYILDEIEGQLDMQNLSPDEKRKHLDINFRAIKQFSFHKDIRCWGDLQEWLDETDFGIISDWFPPRLCDLMDEANL